MVMWRKKVPPKESQDTTAAQSLPRTSVSSHQQNPGSDIEDLIVNQPATYTRSGAEKGTAGGKTLRRKRDTE
jgi:hypothetical protein